MSRPLRAALPTLLIIGLLAACGSREVALDVTGIPTSPTSAASDAPSPRATSSKGSAVPDGSRGRQTVPTEPADLPSQPARPTGGPDETNTMPLDVTLNRTCARPGDLMSATAETLPRSKLAFAASYADNSFAPNFMYVPAEGNPTGSFTWSWEITPAHPRGDALVTVVAANSEGEESRGASYDAPFVVADTC